MNKSFKALVLICILILPCFVEAQVGSFLTKYEPSRKWSIGFQLSPTEFQGDADNLKLGMSFGGHAKYSYGQSFALKVNADIGQLKGGRDYQRISRNGTSTKQYNGVFRKGKNVKDAGNQAPSEDSYNFVNNFKDLNINTVFTLGNLSFLRPLRKYQLYMTVGMGVVWSNVKGDWENKKDRWKEVAGDTSAALGEYLSYKGANFTVPFGMGVKRNFGTLLDMGIELRMHYTRSDNLDALSAPIWRNRFTDFYTLVAIQASFKIKSNKKNDENHYDWLNPIESLYEKMDSISEIATGLSKDGDDDGVADFLDKDPNTPEGVNVYGSGIAVDSDGDKIIDANDDEPFSDKGATVDNKGMMIDMDADGVPDYRDEDTKSPTNTLVTNKGIHLASAGSATGGQSSGVGCCDCNDILFPPVVFEPGSSKIKPEYYGLLHEIATKMKECPELKINTIGYPDGAVGAKSGEKLSRNRVNIVVDYLNDYYGIQRNRITVEYKTKIDSDSKYQKNRKVEIKKAK